MSYEPMPADGDSAERAYTDLGLIPPWKRVYNDGVDVTDEPELWPDWVRDPEVLRRRRGRGRG